MFYVKTFTNNFTRCFVPLWLMKEDNNTQTLKHYIWRRMCGTGFDKQENDGIRTREVRRISTAQCDTYSMLLISKEIAV